VTKPSVHAILSDLHRLLASYKKNDFIEASRYVGVSRAMKVTLRSLASEAESAPGGLDRPSNRRSNSGSSRNRLAGPSSERNQLLSLIRRSPLFESTHAMVKYAESIGLRLVPGPKESRERLAIKLVNLIQKLPEHEKSEVFNDLLKGRNSQTQGWIDVIKER